MLDRSEVGKRGYLNEDYRLFHPKDTRALKLGYHYHEFDKLVFLLRGRTSYTIEGKRVFTFGGAIRIERPAEALEKMREMAAWLCE